jgi:hypothetical protein
LDEGRALSSVLKKTVVRGGDETKMNPTMMRPEDRVASERRQTCAS